MASRIIIQVPSNQPTFNPAGKYNIQLYVTKCMQVQSDYHSKIIFKVDKRCYLHKIHLFIIWHLSPILCCPKSASFILNSQNQVKFYMQIRPVFPGLVTYSISIESVKHVAPKWSDRSSKVDHLVLSLSQWCTIVAYQIP